MNKTVPRSPYTHQIAVMRCGQFKEWTTLNMIRKIYSSKRKSIGMQKMLSISVPSSRPHTHSTTTRSATIVWRENKTKACIIDWNLTAVCVCLCMTEHLNCSSNIFENNRRWLSVFRWVWRERSSQNIRIHGVFSRRSYGVLLNNVVRWVRLSH